MKLVLLIIGVALLVVLFVLCLVDASFCTLRHVSELLSLALAFVAASFLPLR